MFNAAGWRAARAEFAFIILVLGLSLLFRTAAYGMYYIPSESMLPTLSVGDRIAVSKFACGYSRHSAPFSLAPDFDTPDGRIFGRLPARGDIVVFKHPRTGEAYIKRVIGLPGDKITMADGKLIINDRPVDRTLTAFYSYREHRGGVAEVGRFRETLGKDIAHDILERGDSFRGDFFGPIKVPENNLFVMGDNRDNSLDSRFFITGVGLLPVDHLVGRAEIIVFSTNAPPQERGLFRHVTHWFTPL